MLARGDDPPETPRWLKAPFLRHEALAAPVLPGMIGHANLLQWLPTR